MNRRQISSLRPKPTLIARTFGLSTATAPPHTPPINYLPPPPMASPSSSPTSPPQPPSKSEPLLLPAPVTKPQSPTKKSAPIPWSHQETLALIEAYQEKWYSLKKGQLKAFQWEEVAATIAANCGFVEPSKTSTQCRHKIEKLRKRYRSELQKPYPNSWQYFQLMDRMERGPIPVNARPIATVKSASHNASGSNSKVNPQNYASAYSHSADYYYNSSGSNINNNIIRGGNGGGSDESDEEWNVGGGYGVEEAKRNKSKSINNIVRGDVKRVGMERGFSSGSDRVVRVLRNHQLNGKRKNYYDGDDSDGDDEEEDEDVKEEEEMLMEEEGEDGGGGRELAAEIRGFAERFMRMENKKIEMIRDTERYRMEMEKKRMEMILEAQRKVIDTIGRAFGDDKKSKMGQES